VKNTELNLEHNNNSIALKTSAVDKFPEISEKFHPALSQLYALGYAEGNTITGRNISTVGKNTDWCATLTEDNLELQYYDFKKKDYSGEIYNDGLAKLTEDNYDSGIYYNVNGGRNNDSVKRFYAIFWEADHGTFADHAELNSKLNLDLTVAITTKRSTHSYLRVNEDDCRDLVLWKRLQETVAYYMGSDPSVKDLPRLMRLAGFDHIKEGSFQYGGDIDFDSVPCKLITCEPDNVYSTDEILEAFTKLGSDLGIQKFSKERFSGYQYINNKLNQKKKRKIYTHANFTPNIFRTCSDSEVSELLTRAKNYARLCETRDKSLETSDPDTAWTDSLEVTREYHKKEYQPELTHRTKSELKESGLVDGETISEYFARNYGFGFNFAGEPGARQQWHTCQCPAHGSSSGSTDNLHINHSDPNYKQGSINCKTGCDTDEIMTAFRQLAKDAGDKLWNATSTIPSANDLNRNFSDQKESKNPKIIDLKIINEVYSELNSIDVARCSTLGIKIKKINKEFLTGKDLGLSPHKISIIKSPKGTGKTKALVSSVQVHQFEGIASWHTRISLGLKMAADLNIDFKPEKKSQKQAFCSNSAHNFHPKNLFQKGLLVADEFDQIMQYNFESLCNKDGMRPVILNYLKAHLQSALNDGSALFMSEDISQKEIDYIKAIAPAGTELEVIINDFKPKRGVLKFSDDKDFTGMLKILEEKIADGIPCFVIDDLKDGCFGGKSIVNYLTEKYPEKKIKIINSETSGLEAKFITNINEESLELDVIVCSPSITAGVSLENQRFNNGVFLFANGIFDSNAASQALGRVRGASEIYVWVAEQGFNYEQSHKLSPEDVNNYYQKLESKRFSVIQNFNPDYDILRHEFTSPAWDLFCKNAALKNISMANLRDKTKEKLIKDGYQLEVVTLVGDNSVIDSLDTAWTNIELTEIAEIDAVELPTEEEFKVISTKINKQETLTKKEKSQFVKNNLLRTFGEELINKTTSEFNGGILTGFAAIAHKNRDKKFQGMCFKYFNAVHQPLIESVKRDLRKDDAQSFLGGRFPGDISTGMLDVDLFQRFSLGQFINLDKGFTDADCIDTYKALKTEFKDNSKHWIHKFKPAASVAKLLKEYGLEFVTQANGQVPEKRIDGKKVRVYRIEPTSLEFLESFSKYQIAKREPMAFVVEIDDLNSNLSIPDNDLWVEQEFFSEFKPNLTHDRLASANSDTFRVTLEDTEVIGIVAGEKSSDDVLEQLTVLF
jgi:hypothetical protein